jgi:nicotinamide-nucleotide amidase
MLLTPGVPAEMKAIAEGSALARFAALGRPTAARTLRIAGLHEGGVDEAVRDLWEGLLPGERFALQIARGEVHFRILVTGTEMKHCDARMRELADAARARLGPAVYGIDDESLEGVVIAALARHHASLACAESVTGGLLLGRLTAVPGSSAVVRGGFVVYQEAMKREWLGLGDDILAGPGAVSAAAAERLASEARTRARAEWGLATTGWAGPGGPQGDGGGDGPGTVYVGLAGPAGTSATRFAWRGGRETIRDYTVTAALDLLRRALAG